MDWGNEFKKRNESRIHLLLDHSLRFWNSLPGFPPISLGISMSMTDRGGDGGLRSGVTDTATDSEADEVNEAEEE